MPLDDDDNPSAAPYPPKDAAAPDAEDDAEDGPFDMKLFTSMFHKKGIAVQSVRKGQKDFESHGTKAQDQALEASRRVIEEVLSYTRIHKDDWNKGWYFPDHWPQALEEMANGTEEAAARPEFVRNIDPSIHVRDCVVVLEQTKGQLFKSIGRSVRGLKPPQPAIGKTWLLPEEALFLVERGSLDLWWPDVALGEIIMPAFKAKKAEAGDAASGARDAEAPVVISSSPTGSTGADGEEEEEEEEEDDDDYEEFANGLPLSLQAAYAFFIGLEGERGKVTLPKYQVYAHLKRSGYHVLRAPPPAATRTVDDDEEARRTRPREPQQQPSTTPRTLWQWLFSLLSKGSNTGPSPVGPLVKPGLYRSYVPVYDQLELLWRYKPLAERPEPAAAPEAPYKVFYHVWRPSKHAVFTKSDPPPPDFRIAVVDARDTSVPSLEEVTALLASTPHDAADPAWVGAGKMYQRLKHGHRNVLIAVVDRGLVNFMRFGEGTFGEEKLFERFDGRGSNQRGGKRGGRGGRGGGRGRGRGRGGRRG
ncbi:hypothetical protein SODALDRAFT_319795 [Sodiomyces alkalinus F11]|uniref:tRNA-splicing endonuclease subunit Sen54 N-terminal domain-containing protein n=1 Tax=Sodiomyces alkalinus (strain CBS 110278 / VKM F-3762 / F11) TaxID=1314773 RepID=A0A3N2Q981_SODAK|nr:hypothetical protein SODALDRAFT_319795 [Sodiomyces alkalinus F11]ROT43310.1 hypothetical protein SODALDRAFT_319795 [Sodiomyces alkalinus F11]